MADCEAALSIGGPDEAAYFLMGQARLLSGNLEQAVLDFDSAVECKAESGRAYYGRALAKELMGDSRGSGSDYSRAKELGYDDESWSTPTPESNYSPNLF